MGETVLEDEGSSAQRTAHSARGAGWAHPSSSFLPRTWSPPQKVGRSPTTRPESFEYPCVARGGPPAARMAVKSISSLKVVEVEEN